MLSVNSAEVRAFVEVNGVYVHIIKSQSGSSKEKQVQSADRGGNKFSNTTNSNNFIEKEMKKNAGNSSSSKISRI